MTKLLCVAVAILSFAIAAPTPEMGGTNIAIYDNFNGSITYGEPKQIALIRARKANRSFRKYEICKACRERKPS